MKTITICTAIAVMCGVAAHAADITWNAPVLIAGASDVNTSGTVFGTWAPGDDAYDPDNHPINGVTFNAYGSLPGLTVNASGLDHYTSFNNPWTPDTDYNNLLRAAVFNWNTDPIVVGWNGMTVGHTYLLQVWVNDARSIDRTVTITGGANTSLTLQIAPVPTGPGQYIIGEFIADGSGAQTITLTPGGNYGTQINLLQVRDITSVPEPSTLAVLGFGAGALFLGFRRKAVAA